MDIISYVIGKKSGGASNYTLTAGSSTLPAYQKIMEQIPEITITGTSCTYMFYNCKASSLPKLKGTEQVVNTSNMFSGCNNITKLDLSKYTFGTITNASSMFASCQKLAVLDISTLDLTDLASGKYTNIFSGTGYNCVVKDGAYSSGVPYIYVKNTAMQNWVLNTSGAPNTWSTDNVKVK